MGAERHVNENQFVDLHHWSNFDSVEDAMNEISKGGGLLSYSKYYGEPDEGGAEGLVWAFDDPERGWKDSQGAMMDSEFRNTRISFRVPKSEAVYQGEGVWGVEGSVHPSSIYRYTRRSNRAN